MGFGLSRAATGDFLTAGFPGGPFGRRLAAVQRWEISASHYS
jgi:hypothetical protein